MLSAKGYTVEKIELQAKDKPFVAVDLVLLTVRDGALHALLMRRDREPCKDQWALPGGFVRIEESLEDAVSRVLRNKVQLEGIFFEQLYSFGTPARDPRGRVVSIAYYALVESAAFDDAAKTSGELSAFRVEVPWDGQCGGAVHVRSSDGRKAALAFDHAEILGAAVARLRGKLDYSPVGFELLPRYFSLRQLQSVHEAILGKALNKPAFRRRILDKGVLQATGRFETGVSYRPAELYQFRNSTLKSHQGGN